ncbi:MAG TPA: FtsH protease activity modulator HflK [Verrucomicrobiae bacterium]|nr:FtsH protease activity modulator HflK [Verrucomicrobiae bacterium]
MLIFFHHDEAGGGHDHPHPHEHHHHHEHGHDHGHEHARGGAVWEWLGRRWPVIVGLCVVGWLVSGIRVVGPAERGVVQRFGRVIDDRVTPGIRFGLPVGIETLTKVQISKTRRVSVGGGGVDGLTGNLPDPARSQFFSGDRNIVDVQLSVQYVISDPKAFLFATADPDAAVRGACESALCEIAAAMPVDEILTLRKAEVQLRVREMAQAILDRHGVGVRVLSVSQERSAPPEKVADAFRAVTSARADRDRLIAEAEGYREDLLPRARGEATAVLAQAEGEAYQVVALAEARARRFERILEEAKGAPTLTRRRMHAEVIEEILSRTRKVILKPGAAGDVRLIEEGP